MTTFARPVLIPALTIATLALGGIFPASSAFAHRNGDTCVRPPLPPQPPAPPIAPQPPAPPAPPEIDMGKLDASIADSRRDALAALGEARAQVAAEANMPPALRKQILAELDAALARAQHAFAHSDPRQSD